MRSAGECHILLKYSRREVNRCERMLTRRKLALYFLAALALAGAYDALRNLPVLSGCNFYSECPDNSSPARGGPGD